MWTHGRSSSCTEQNQLLKYFNCAATRWTNHLEVMTRSALRHDACLQGRNDVQQTNEQLQNHA